MWSSLALYGRLLAVQVQQQMQYRVSFLMELFTTALIIAVEFGTVALILQRFNDVAGWTLGEIAFLYGAVTTAFGIMDILFSGFDPQVFGRRVRRGTFDQMLLRPINITLQVLASRLEIRRLGEVFQGVLILGLAFVWVDIPWSGWKTLYLPLVILSQICFFGGLFIIGATITFWTIESIEVINIFTYGGSEMMAYPMHIYPRWMRRFFTFVVPAIFLNYYPALYFLGKPDPFQLPAFVPFLAPLAGGAVLGVALLFWRLGIQHYQSTGS